MDPVSVIFDGKVTLGDEWTYFLRIIQDISNSLHQIEKG